MSTDSTSTTTTYGTISKSFNGTSNPKPNGKSEISPIIENQPKNNKSKIRNKSYPQRNDRVEITKFNSNPSTPISKPSMIFAQSCCLKLIQFWKTLYERISLYARRPIASSRISSISKSLSSLYQLVLLKLRILTLEIVEICVLPRFE